MADEPARTRDGDEAVVALLGRGMQLARELVAENRRLRRRLDLLEQQPGASGQEATARHDELEKLEAEQTLEQLRKLEQENQRLTARCVAQEQENTHLANLYVASYQLHATLDLAEVLGTIVEIVINLIGAEAFAIYELDERSATLHAVAAEGREPGACPTYRLGEGAVGDCVARGETLCRDASRSDDLEAPLVCIPLRVQERALGAIVIERLLVQKDGFTPLDRELFELLAGHAATAIFAARLHAHAERKLHTMQGFLDLLTR